MLSLPPAGARWPGLDTCGAGKASDLEALLPLLDLVLFDYVAALAGSVAGVEVMPYHALGRDKRRRLALEDPPDWPSATETQARAWLDALASRGCPARLG